MNRYQASPWNCKGSEGTWRFAITDTAKRGVTCCYVHASKGVSNPHDALAALVDSKETAEAVCEYLNTLYPAGTPSPLSYASRTTNLYAIKAGKKHVGDMYTSSAELLTDLSEYLTNLATFGKRASR